MIIHNADFPKWNSYFRGFEISIILWNIFLSENIIQIGHWDLVWFHGNLTQWPLGDVMILKMWSPHSCYGLSLWVLLVKLLWGKCPGTPLVMSQNWFSLRLGAIIHLPIDTLRPRQDGHYFTADIFKCIFINQNVRIVIDISLKFAPNGSINKILALV